MPEFSEASPPQGGIDRAVRCIQFVISEEGRLVYNPRDPRWPDQIRHFATRVPERGYPRADL
jgi:hypothetical protein